MAMTHHENIVKFLGLELIKGWSFERRAIIMECCTKGTLQHLINDNPNGLQSEEFFRVARQLVSAVEYLFKMRIAHRDIKPNNVMIAEDFDGTSLYKLGDFGFACQLKPREKYTLPYGTHEFFHVDLFVKAYYNDLGITPKVKEFGLTHDLWSLGVTLYAAAAGRLPFQPKNGRKGLKVMYEMISRKQDGQIAATQTENGIEWTSHLPETSSVAKDERVTQFLARCINVSKNKSNIYDLFLFRLFVFFSNQIYLIIKKLECFFT